MEMDGLLTYGVFFLTQAGIYAVLALGLNVQYGLTGQINIGIAGFFAVGAYTSAIVTTHPSTAHLGGFNLPFPVGVVAAMATSALVAAAIGRITMRLRSDYLAIATIGIAEIIRLALKNEDWLTNGVRGIPGIPRPFSETLGANPLISLGVVLGFVAFAFWMVERARSAPWGRVLRAIRENEDGVSAAGKDVAHFRLQAFVFGASLMGMAGALYAHFIGFISPEAFLPLYGTFLVWVMLIAGGAGNNWGALVGALAIWVLWSATQFMTDALGAEYATQAGALRVLLIGVLLQVILIARPQGLLPERGARKH
ncbi:branched-chain amino acid ABC transporter permease [Roseospira marina]|uniref:Branched-chain amino acid ABC transporter permease n=1 Tax=Roseospira marina TaxID=140057 RepID=A0A5M6IHT7_9PROT|nr:branched-chain amino acid ABC transporter permease [Roseospira marina]KAA5607517.1 branched-chain amino acid ABC transporter permease [Roseospira marina]MBB4312298.1 branched-chain amino acid transport system permease protein [Roseospira marina]MBB5085686.1 branched-chain amino acid transport system permease protein [Roseospira marina]